MKNTGKDYEAFVHELYQALNKDKRFSSVELDVKLKGPEGFRQIDVLLRYQVEGKDALTFIECRDYAKRLDITHVEQLHSKLMDFNAKGVLISRKGFSKAAKSKAKRIGIDLCLASTADEVLAILDLEVPVVLTVVETQISALGSTFESTGNQSGLEFTAEGLYTINGVYLADLYRDEVLTGKTQIPLESSTVKWKPSSITPPYMTNAVSYMDGELVDSFIESIEIQLTIRHYFGYFSDFKNTSALHNVELNEVELFIKTEEIPNMHKNLALYKRYEDIPKLTGLKITSVSMPTTLDGRITIKRIA